VISYSVIRIVSGVWVSLVGVVLDFPERVGSPVGLFLLVAQRPDASIFCCFGVAGASFNVEAHDLGISFPQVYLVKKDIAH